MLPDDAIIICAGIILFMLVVWISIVDLRHLIIPDLANLLLAATGFFYMSLTSATFPWPSVGGALCLFVLLYFVRLLHSRFRGTVGLGLGDVKLGGAAGLWLQPLDLPMLLLIASIGAIAGIIILHTIRGGILGTRRLPFGPFLGISLLAVWYYEALFQSGFDFSEWF
jgi:prepilin signal peptidase PulO-like enzyme (type II secretory pathway)